MIEEDDSDDSPPVREDVVKEDVFQWMITQLCCSYYEGESELENQTQVFNVWLKLGEILNIPHILPYNRAIVLGDAEEDPKPIVSYIMTTNKEVLEDLVEYIDENTVEKLADSLEERKKKYS
jgi:hypothetical protein